MLLGDLYFPVRPAHDHRGVVGVDQARLGVQVLDHLVVVLGIGGAVIHPGEDDERIDCHPSTPQSPATTARRYGLPGPPGSPPASDAAAGPSAGRVPGRVAEIFAAG